MMIHSADSSNDIHLSIDNGNEMLDVVLSLFESLKYPAFIFQKYNCIRCNTEAARQFKTCEQELVAEGPFIHSPIHQPDGALSSRGAETILSGNGGHGAKKKYWVFQTNDGSPFEKEVIINRIQLKQAGYTLMLLKDLPSFDLSRVLKQTEEQHSAITARIERLASLLAVQEDRTHAIEENLLSRVKQLIESHLEKVAAYPCPRICVIDGQAGKSLHQQGDPAPEKQTLPPEVLYALNPNEVKIMKMISKGKATKEIATTLKLAPSSVAWYRHQIRNKFGLTNTKTNLRAFLTKEFNNNPLD